MSSLEADRVAFLADCYQQAASRATWSFAQGLILGQFSVIVLVVVCVRYLLLEDPRRAQADNRSRRLQASRVLSIPLPASIVDILIPESCEWLNVLLAQVLEQFRSDAQQDGRLVSWIDRILNDDVRPSFMSHINVTEASLGEDYPIFQDACIQPSTNHNGICAEIAFEFHDQITLAFDTRLVLNWPRAMLAALPVSLSLSVVKFSGTLMVERTTLVAISVAPDFTLGFAVKSLIGHRTKVRDLPKVTELIAMRLRAVFAQSMVAPNRRVFSVPDLWPKSFSTDRNTGNASQESGNVDGNTSINSNIGNMNGSNNNVDMSDDNPLAVAAPPPMAVPRRRHTTSIRGDRTNAYHNDGIPFTNDQLDDNSYRRHQSHITSQQQQQQQQQQQRLRQYSHPLRPQFTSENLPANVAHGYRSRLMGDMNGIASSAMNGNAKPMDTRSLPAGPVARETDRRRKTHAHYGLAGETTKGGPRSVMSALDAEYTATSTPVYSRMTSPLRSPTLYGHNISANQQSGNHTQQQHTSATATGADEADRTRSYRRPNRVSNAATPSVTLDSTTTPANNVQHHNQHGYF
ncbi:hypothetical protein BDF22DRAFT_662361 [Syncephalis plumigaleata]|nr:hypothetical protein BDF22DRAFT_662361 [Syncephalis plumigaleata]